MYPLQPTDQNPFTQNSFLSSKYFDPVHWFNSGYNFFHSIFAYITSHEATNLFYMILAIFATFFIFIIFYGLIRVLEIRKKEHHHLEHEIAEYAHHQKEREEKMQAEEGISGNPRWRTTLNYLFSINAGDWKLAIIEADSMLDGLLDQLGFRGENIGEKLKSAGQDGFRNLPTAWEVHTIRNRIAHEGAAYEISQHEAKRVIALYEKIFRDYGFI